MRNLGPENPDIFYDVACCYSLCIPSVAYGKKQEELTPEEKSTQADYTAKAMDAFTQAFDHGYKNLEHMEKDPDLVGLRGIPAFQKQVDCLKNSSLDSRAGSKIACEGTCLRYVQGKLEIPAILSGLLL
jgi:hypothetical protein